MFSIIQKYLSVGTLLALSTATSAFPASGNLPISQVPTPELRRPIPATHCLNQINPNLHPAGVSRSIGGNGVSAFDPDNPCGTRVPGRRFPPPPPPPVREIMRQNPGVLQGIQPQPLPPGQSPVQIK